MRLELQKCQAEEVDALREMSIKTYYDTFAALCAPEDMTAYLAQAYNRSKLLGELKDARMQFYFLHADGRPAGYLKQNEAPSQTDINDRASLEIERIYICAALQGKGLGKYLMEQAIGMARERGKQYVWLGVWERNEKAIRFYRRNGFYTMGTHEFIMGDDRQTDHIMRRDLAEPVPAE